VAVGGAVGAIVGVGVGTGAVWQVAEPLSVKVPTAGTKVQS
jgi:hypothetical protein